MTPPVYTPAARPEVVTESLPTQRPGWTANITSADHKTVGRMFIATALVFLAATITLLVMMRLQLIIPDSDFMRPQIFDRLLSVYGVSAVLLFAVPLFMGLITHIVPLQIGARGVALPRLGALSFWFYLAGAVTIYASFLYLPSEAGTAALPPLSDTLFTPNNGVDAWAAGVGLVCLSMIAFAVNMITTIRRDRAPGMYWRRVSLFSYAAAVISWTMMVIAPLMAAAVTMLLIDRNFDGVFFDAGEQGAPLLYQHLAWIFFTGVYAIIVTAGFGVISEIFSTFSRQPHFGHRTIAGSMAAFTVLVVLAWMQNMYSAPIREGFLYFAMLCAVAATVPAGLIVFNWIGTLRGGDSRMKPPLKFALGAAVLLVIGLAGELAQSVIPVSWQVAHTQVAWGDTHFALIGAGLLGGFAALYYWFPKISGRYMGESLARGSFVLLIAGALLMILPAQLAGLEGMPVDVYKYFEDTGMSTYNLIASIGSFVLALGIILTLVNAAASYNNGTLAGPDAWAGNTLEWFTPSPPPPHNFDVTPTVRSLEPMRDYRRAIEQREAAASNGHGAVTERPSKQPEPL
jgi:heme/copper-type cytochrome/quinol oxidase subunit 1